MILESVLALQLIVASVTGASKTLILNYFLLVSLNGISP